VYTRNSDIHQLTALTGLQYLYSNVMRGVTWTYISNPAHPYSNVMRGVTWTYISNPAHPFVPLGWCLGVLGRNLCEKIDS
jgi:hypothetical protein